MRDMKDSGVKWIGKIPSSWNVVSTKFLFHILSGATPDSSKPEYWDGNITWITPADYKTKDVFVNAGRRSLSQIGFDSCSTSMIPAGSIIFSKRAPIGSVAINRTDLCTNQGCLSCISKGNSYVKYYYYVMSIATEHYELLGSGTTFKEISATNFGNFVLPYPDYQVQIEISNYLDSKCVQVDALIANVQAQIEKLKAYKQSVVAEIVTKGLDPTVPMKDSNVDWLGEYPSHWSYMPFGYVLKERNEKNNPVISEERLSLSIELGVTLYAEKTTNLDRFKDDFSQYKLAHTGDLVMNSMNMIVGATGVSPYFGCVSPAYYTFYDETDDHITAKYCEYIFRSKTMLRVLHSLGKGIYSIERGDDRINTCRLKVPKVDLKSLHIPVPPIEEQRTIVSYLNEKCTQIDQLIAIKQAKIEKLEQYKRSLIYEYVTGKKEVPAQN